MTTDGPEAKRPGPGLDEDQPAFDARRFYRESWWLEEGLVNQRLEWLLKSQAFIGAVYAYLAREPLPSSQQPFAGALLAYLPVFAALLCLFVLIGIWAAHAAQDGLLTKVPAGTLGSSSPVKTAGRLVPTVISWLFLLGWLLVWKAQP